MSENRLGRETSPYLLQHKDNPVHWWPWGPEALAEAKATGRPILLSVGYAACHWCHVMAHESFEDEQTGSIMNELFVNIKVDREERPDIDAIYMGALHRLGEQGGWPLTMFLDSDARPFWGGTYFPKQARYGRPSFATVLLRMADAFHNQPDNVAKNAGAILAALEADSADETAPALTRDQVRDLITRITRAFDPKRGGLGGAPKFPQWNVLWLVWRGAIGFGDDAAKRAVLTTLTNICQGGIYDHLGGGFARYAVDDAWLVPHFEKMLYDNALLIDLLTEAWRETHDPLYAARIAETVDWLAREMIADGGGFAASLDADSEGEEGKFYVWAKAEIDEVLGVEDAAWFGSVYGVTAGGNFEGHTILNRLGTMALLSDADEQRLAALRAKLLARRAGRIPPGWDDKVLADWNGLTIAALARASCVFARPDWLALATHAFDFVVTRMSLPGDRLWHSFRAGQGRAPGSASDYANMTWAALRLFETSGEARHLEAARRWTDTLERHHWDAASGGYFTAADDTADVIVRLKSAGDDAVPNANAIQLSNLVKLSALTGEPAYEAKAEALAQAFSGALADRPVGHCGLVAATLDLDQLIQVTVQAGQGPMVAALYGQALPGALERVAANAPAPSAVAPISKSGDVSTAYICRGPVCGAPLADAEAFAGALSVARRLGTVDQKFAV